MTIRDVAEYCGVSVSTVSRVLNNRPDVSSDVRSKVLAAIEELHYIPNNSARSLVHTSSANIGVIVRGGGNPFYTPIIQAMERAINKRGYSMSIRHIPSGADEIATGASLARSKRLSALIFLGGCFDYDINRIAAIEIPFLTCTFTNSFGYLPDDIYSSVSIDDRAEARNAVKYLIDKGHRRIAIILDSRNDRSISQLRYMGYYDALNEAGIEADEKLICETGFYELEPAYTCMNRMLDNGTDCSAVFVIADALAIACMKAVYEHGLRIPEDISVIAIDGLDISRYTHPTLTTITQPGEILGQQAADTIIDVIEGKALHRHITLPASLRIGDSVRDLTL